MSHNPYFLKTRKHWNSDNLPNVSFLQHLFLQTRTVPNYKRWLQDTWIVSEGSKSVYIYIYIIISESTVVLSMYVCMYVCLTVFICIFL